MFVRSSDDTAFLALASLIWPHINHVFLQWKFSPVDAVATFCISMFPKRKKCALTSVVIKLSLVPLSSNVNL